MKLVEIAQRYYFNATFLGYPEKNQQQFASGMNEIKYPTTKQDSTDRNSNDNIHETFSGLLTLYLNSRFVMARSKLRLITSISYSPLSDLCNSKIVISDRVVLMLS